MQQQLQHGSKQKAMRNMRERIKLQGIVDRRALAAHYLEEYGVRIDNDSIERLTER